MKKRLALVFLFLILLTSFSSCHGAKISSAFAVPDSFDSSRRYEITFWAKNDTNKTQTKVYENAIASFEKLYPEIKVNMRLYTDYNKIYNDVITNISTDTTPNVCITYPDHIATYITGRENVVNLDSLLDDVKYGLGGSEVRFASPAKEDVVPGFLEECSLSGGHYAVPFMRSTEACYINKTFVEKLGYELPEILTWDLMWEIAEKAAEKDAQGNYVLNGQKVMLPIIYKSTDNMMIQMLRQKGKDTSDASGNIHLFEEETDELLTDIASHTAKGAFSTFKISSYPANFLNAGQCVFAIDSTAGATWMGTDAPLLDISPDKIVKFETAVLPVPQFDPEHPQMISQGPSICVFSKEDPQIVLASWLFAQYLLTDEVQIAYSQTEGYIPVTTKALEFETYRDYLSESGKDNSLHYDVKIKASELLIRNIENTFTSPVFNGSVSVRNAAGELVENVTKTVRRKGEVNKSYLEGLYSDTASLYRLDQLHGQNAGSLGKLPVTSVILLSSLAAAWVIMGIYVLVTYLKSRKSGGTDS